MEVMVVDEEDIIEDQELGEEVVEGEDEVVVVGDNNIDEWMDAWMDGMWIIKTIHDCQDELQLVII